MSPRFVVILVCSSLIDRSENSVFDCNSPRKTTGVPKSIAHRPSLPARSLQRDLATKLVFHSLHVK